jgi:hypothetical protein
LAQRSNDFFAFPAADELGPIVTDVARSKDRTLARTPAARSRRFHDSVHSQRQKDEVNSVTRLVCEKMPNL